MDNENKYHWDFRQTVGRGYNGYPIMRTYTFDSILGLVRAIFYFKYKMFERAFRRGWSKRWEV